MTAADLYHRLLTIFPEFESYWNSADNDFREENGLFTCCGVFSRFSHFIRENFPNLSPVALDQLGGFVEDCLKEASHSDLYDATASCFLENLDAEDITRDLAAYLGPKARELLQSPQ